MQHTGFSNADLAIERNSVTPAVTTTAAKQNDRRRAAIYRRLRCAIGAQSTRRSLITGAESGLMRFDTEKSHLSSWPRFGGQFVVPDPTKAPRAGRTACLNGTTQ